MKTLDQRVDRIIVEIEKLYNLKFEDSHVSHIKLKIIWCANFLIRDENDSITGYEVIHGYTTEEQIVYLESLLPVKKSRAKWLLILLIFLLCCPAIFYISLLDSTAEPAKTSVVGVVSHTPAAELIISTVETVQPPSTSVFDLLTTVTTQPPKLTAPDQLATSTQELPTVIPVSLFCTNGPLADGFAYDMACWKALCNQPTFLPSDCRIYPTLTATLIPTITPTLLPAEIFGCPFTDRQDHHYQDLCSCWQDFGPTAYNNLVLNGECLIPTPTLTSTPMPTPTPIPTQDLRIRLKVWASENPQAPAKDVHVWAIQSDTFDTILGGGVTDQDGVLYIPLDKPVTVDLVLCKQHYSIESTIVPSGKLHVYRIPNVPAGSKEEITLPAAANAPCPILGIVNP